MAIAALVLGIISFLLSIVPFFGIIAIIPAIIGAILGIVAIAKKSDHSKAMQITGLVLSILAGFITIFWMLFLIYISDIPKHTISTQTETNDIIQRKEKTYEIGDDVRFNDMILKVDKVEKTQGTEEIKAKEGYEFITVTISIKNISSYPFEVSPLDFRVKDEKSNNYDSDYIKIKSITSFKTTELGVGETMTGVVAFEVPKTVNKLTLRYFNYEKDVNIRLNNIAEI